MDAEELLGRAPEDVLQEAAGACVALHRAANAPRRGQQQVREHLVMQSHGRQARGLQLLAGALATAAAAALTGLFQQVEQLAGGEHRIHLRDGAKEAAADLFHPWHERPRPT